MGLTPNQVHDIQAVVWDYYRRHPRSMPWREDPQPYYVLVSELMLQQTQVSRVIPKFETFIVRFPDIVSLAQSSLAEVLAYWSGLGYNRRARFLWEAAGQVVERYDGQLPADYDQLISLTGIGPNTAGAILAYAFNQPVGYVETNVRTVLFHHFYEDSARSVTDKELLSLARQIVDTEHPREWYWALMDYGSHLKRHHGGRLTQSASYKKQSPLKGSVREMRGEIIRRLIDKSCDDKSLREAVRADERYEPALQALIKEGLVTQDGQQLSLTGASDSR